MNRQWGSVIGIGIGLAGATWALVRFGSPARPIEVGQEAPPFVAVSLTTGDTVSMTGTFKGQVVLVNLWATWCPPCREEMPSLQRLHQELGPQGFKLAAISVDEGDPQDVLSFAKKYGLTFDMLHDGDGSVQKLFQTTGFPESFLIDRNGVVVKKIIGAHPWSSPASREVVAQLLGVERGPDPTVQPE